MLSKMIMMNFNPLTAMKKITSLSAAAIATLIAFTSCNKEQVVEIPENEGIGKIELTINAGSPETKTVFGENTGAGYPITWSETGEAIKLVELLTPTSGDASYKAYTSTGYTLSNANSKAVFSASVNELTTEGTYDYRAIYPASAYQSANLQYSDLYVKIPDSQTPTAASPDADATILYAASTGLTAQPTDVLDLAFSHVTAYGKMTIKNASSAFDNASEEIQSVSVSVPAGGIYYYWSDGSISPVNATKKDEISIKTDNLDTSGDFVVWFSCAPYSLAIDDILTVSVTTAANTYTRKITMTKAMSFESGKVSKFSVNMSTASAAVDLSGDYLVVSTDATNPWHVMTYDVSNGFYLGESTAVAAATTIDTDDASTNFSSYCIDTYVWTLNKVSGGYTLQNARSGKYVSWSSGNTATAVDDAITLVVADAGSGVFTVKHSSDESRVLQFNYNSGSNPRFAFYTSSQKALTFIPVASYKHKLNTPNITSASASGTTITVEWDADNKASSYTVTCTGQADQNISKGTNTASFTGLADGTYAVTVTAVGDGSTYVTSETASVSNIKVGGTSGGTDVLNQTWTGVTGTSYTAVTGLAGSTSAAVYSVQCAGGNSSIQLRSKNSSSGIVSTTSGGKVTKVVVTWNSNTDSGRTITIYGSNTAYTAPSDLYSTSTQGDSLGTIVCGTSTELTITGSYSYIGIRSASGALYLDEVDITWE